MRGGTQDAPEGSARARILVLIKGLDAGGAERLVLDLVAAGRRDRFDYEVAFARRDDDALVPELEGLGVAVHRLGARASWDLRWVLSLRRLLRDGRFDVVHSHLPYTGAFARVAAATLPVRRRPKLVYTEHNLWQKTATLTRLLCAVTARLDDAVLAVSGPVRESLPSGLRRRVQVVVHGIDRARLPSTAEVEAARHILRAGLGIGDDDVVALTVANLREQKGYEVLLEAARNVDDERLRFLAVGTGPLEVQLAGRLRQLDLGERFRFLGARTDVFGLMAASDLFVLPSHFEGMPIALMEAMASGLPSVATAVGGVPDMMRDEVDGILVPPADPVALGAAVQRLASDPELRRGMGAAARRRAEAFDIRRAAAQVEAVYERLLEPQMTRVPLVVHVVPTTIARGAQREAQALADRLDDPGVRRHVLVSLFGSDGHIPVAHVVDPARQEPPTFDLRVVLRLRRLLTRLRPDLVVAHGGDALKYLVPAMAGRHVPVVYYATGLFSPRGRRARRGLWRALLRRPDVVAAEGSEVLEECRHAFGVPPDRSVLAANGRDTARFQAGDRRRKDVPVLAFVGALSPEKRPERFVELVGELRDRGRPLRAILCGDGPMAQSLRAPANAVEVELLGARDDVAEILRGTDVLVFTGSGDGEGMPGVLIEAALSEIPVVTTPVPGSRDLVVDGETGFVVGADDMATAVEVVTRLLTDAELRRRMGAAARAHCAARFSLEAVADCWLGIIEPLLRGGAGVRDRRAA